VNKGREPASGAPEGARRATGGAPEQRPGPQGRWDYGHCIYWHELSDSFPICGPEPNWAKLEAS